MRTLLVEDHEDLSHVLAGGLRRAGFAVGYCGRTVVDAREAALLGDYALAILDLGLPDGSGLELLAEWRDRRHSRSLFTRLGVLWATGSRWLDSGADDYIVKPVEIPNLWRDAGGCFADPETGKVSRCRQGGYPGCANREATCNGQHVPWGDASCGVLEALVSREMAASSPERHCMEMLYVPRRRGRRTPNAVDAAVSRVRRALDEAAADVSIRTSVA